MHVGEKPYVVTSSASMYAYRGPLAWGHVELSSRVLTTDTVAGMLEQLLPSDQLKALVEYGAIEYDLPHEASGDLFTVVAARGGDDVWLELRRTPVSLGTMETPEPVAASSTDQGSSASVFEPATPQTESVPEQTVEEPEPVATAPETDAEESSVSEPMPETDVELPPVAEAAATTTDTMPTTEPLAIEMRSPDETATFEVVEDEPQTVPTDAEVEELLTASAAAILIGASPEVVTPAASNTQSNHADASTAAEPSDAMPELQHELHTVPPVEASAEERVEPSGAVQQEEQSVVERAPDVPIADEHAPEAPRVHLPEPSRAPEEPRHGVVLPMARPTMASEPPVQIKPVAGTPLERILRIAAARGAATVYVVAQSKPMIRVDGEISAARKRTDADCGRRRTARRGAGAAARERERCRRRPVEWLCDVPEIGRVRCLTFRDHRGPGVLFRMFAAAGDLGRPARAHAGSAGALPAA